MSKKTIISNSPGETRAYGRRLSKRLMPGDIIYLTGELGSGKTVLVKGICQGLGVKEEITSPSFVIATEYNGRMPISHIDLYRLGPSEVEGLIIDEYIKPDGATIIEWADHMTITDNGICIQITIKDKRQREITLEDLRH